MKKLTIFISLYLIGCTTKAPDPVMSASYVQYATTTQMTAAINASVAAQLKINAGQSKIDIALSLISKKYDSIIYVRDKKILALQATNTLIQNSLKISDTLSLNKRQFQRIKISPTRDSLNIILP